MSDWRDVADYKPKRCLSHPLPKSNKSGSEKARARIRQRRIRNAFVHDVLEILERYYSGEEDEVVTVVALNERVIWYTSWDFETGQSPLAQDPGWFMWYSEDRKVAVLVLRYGHAYVNVPSRGQGLCPVNAYYAASKFVDHAYINKRALDAKAIEQGEPR